VIGCHLVTADQRIAVTFELRRCSFTWCAKNSVDQQNRRGPRTEPPRNSPVAALFRMGTDRKPGADRATS